MATTLADVPMGDHRIGDYGFSFSASRWQDGKVAVSPLDKEGMWKSRSTHLLEKFSPYYSHRAGYCLTPANALKLLAAMRAGGEYLSPKEIKEKKSAEKFKKAAIAAIIASGGRPSGQHMYEYTIQTPAGPLAVSATDSWIAGRFDDVERAKSLGLDVGYSGKWNFHSDDAIGDFRRAIARLMARSNPSIKVKSSKVKKLTSAYSGTSMGKRKFHGYRRNPLPDIRVGDSVIVHTTNAPHRWKGTVAKVHASGNWMDLAGPKGGSAVIGVNVHSGRPFLIVHGRGMPKSYGVVTKVEKV